MADLSLRERLQPALLDRLADEERVLTHFRIEARRQDLQRVRLSEREILDILAGQGLRPSEAEDGRAHDAAEELLRWELTAPAGRVGIGPLRGLVLRPPGAPGGIALQDLCRIEAHNVPNPSLETAERRALSMRRLRELVCRDLAALLNAASLDMSVDLTRYPHVQRSVLNYGMPALAGKSAAAIDSVKTAATIEEVIKCFEPRLRKVRVSPEPKGDSAAGHELALRIDAELWGQPAPLQLVLRTRIETDSGAVSVSDASAR